MMKKIISWLATITWASFTYYLTTIPNFSPSPDTLTSWILSNGGHFFFFGIQATLLYLALPKHKYSQVSAVLLTSVYGLFIEFMQLNIPGRSFGVSDWILDTLGAIIFIYILKKYSKSI